MLFLAENFACKDIKKVYQYLFLSIFVDEIIRMEYEWKND